MNIEQYLIPTLTFLIGLVVKDFLPSYAKEKGKNLATKEDVEEITSKVEIIKDIVSRSSKFLTDQQQFSLQFYDVVTDFYYERLSVNIGNMYGDIAIALNEHQKSFNEDVSSIVKSYQRLTVFLPKESPVLLAATQLSEISLKSQKVMNKNFGQLKMAYFREQEAITKDPAKYTKAASQSDDATAIFWNDFSPIVDEFRLKFSELSNHTSEYIKPNPQQ